MLVRALLIVVLCTARPCSAEDDWFGGDKRAHFLGGVLVGGAFAAGTGSRTPGIVTGCGVGAVGELIEAVRFGWMSPRVSAKDFAAECAGGLLGAAIGVQLASDRRVDASRKEQAHDSWRSPDKRAHFIGGFAVSGLAAHFTDSATVGLVSGCSAAAVGELIDARHGWRSKHVSAKDFAAGCLGATAAAFASVQVAPNRIVWSKPF